MLGDCEVLRWRFCSSGSHRVSGHVLASALPLPHSGCQGAGAEGLEEVRGQYLRGSVLTGAVAGAA